MKIKTILLLFIQSVYLLGQNDTLFISYPDINGYNSFNSFVVNKDENYLIKKYSYSSIDDHAFNSLIKTDLNGASPFYKDSIIVMGQPAWPIVFMGDKPDGTLFFSNIEKPDGKNYFVSFIVDNELMVVTLIDSFPLPDHEYFTISKGMKYSPEKKVYQGIGTLRNSISLNPTSNYFISADEDGFFLDHHQIDIAPLPIYLSDFAYLPGSNQYYLSNFGSRSILLDSAFNQLDMIENTFTFQIGDTTVHGAFKLSNCEYNGGNNIVCTGIGGLGQTIYSLSWFEVDCSNSLLELSDPIPLMPENEYKTISFARLAKDGNGDWVFVGVGHLNPVNSAVESNSLYINKLSDKGDIIWSNKFSIPDTELLVYDLITDVNNDIVIIGDYMSEETLGIRKNFLLKIGSDGSATNTLDLPIPFVSVKLYPNPTSGPLKMKFGQLRKNTTGNIYNINGRIEKSFPVISENMELNIGYLPAGNYVLVFENENGTAFPPVKFIKK